MCDITTAMSLWQARGQRPVASPDGRGCWVLHERFSYTRVPCSPGGPDPATLSVLYWRRFAPLVSWFEECHPVDGEARAAANAWFYVCDDPDYDIEKLGRKGRRDVRHGLRSVAVRRMGFDELADLGYEVLADTCRRNRTAPPSRKDFAADCELRGRHGTETAWGAFSGSELCAWVATHRVGDVLEMGPVSMLWERRSLCATYALVFEVVRTALRAERAALVSYGLSSVQTESRAASLHQFKTWLGFRAVPVRRVFELHPLLRPLAHNKSLQVLDRLAGLAPKSRFTSKLRGAIALMRGDAPPLLEQENAAHDTCTDHDHA